MSAYIKELRESLRELGKWFKYAERDQYRADLAHLGRIIRAVGDLVTEQPASAATTSALDDLGIALLGVGREGPRPFPFVQLGVFRVDAEGLGDLTDAVRARIAVTKARDEAARAAQKEIPVNKDGTIDFAEAKVRLSAGRSAERRRDP